MIKLKSLARATPSLESARNETITAAVLNITGMGMEYALGRNVPEIPLWPLFIALAAGPIVLLIAPRLRQEKHRPLISALFIFNSAAVVMALSWRHRYYAEYVQHWVPFQGDKLGCLLAAFLAPDFFSGLITVAAHSLSSVVVYEFFPEALQKKIAFGEPVASLAFALAGLLTLISRFRRILIENEFRRLQAQALAMQKVARTVLKIKDLMNTPLQSIRFACAIQCEQKDRDEKALKSLEQAVKELGQLNSLLDHYEKLADWRTLDETK